MIKPFLKHTGAKIRDLIHFHQYIPNDIEDYYEPFLGGASIMLNTKAERYIVNDLDETLCLFWRELFDERNNFVQRLESYWNNRFNNINDKCSIYKECNKRFLKKGTTNSKYSYDELYNNFMMEVFYYNERHKFNTNPTPENVFFVKEFCYQGMDRYSSKGFNVPYGGMSYSNKDLTNKFNEMRKFASKIQDYQYFMHNESFETFMDKGYGKKDFIFLDPPYTTTFSKYNDNVFVHIHHMRLRDILLDIDARFMLVINKDDFITNLYKDFKIVNTYTKKYAVSYKNRANSVAEHLVITNY